MCCTSTHGMAQTFSLADGYPLADGYRDTFNDTDPTGPEDQCQCTGSVPAGRTVDGMKCRCCRKITGEDLRCNRCRAWCPSEAVNTAVRVTQSRGFPGTP